MALVCVAIIAKTPDAQAIATNTPGVICDGGEWYFGTAFESNAAQLSALPTFKAKYCMSKDKISATGTYYGKSKEALRLSGNGKLGNLKLHFSKSIAKLYITGCAYGSYTKLAIVTVGKTGVAADGGKTAYVAAYNIKPNTDYPAFECVGYTLTATDLTVTVANGGNTIISNITWRY